MKSLYKTIECDGEALLWNDVQKVYDITTVAPVYKSYIEKSIQYCDSIYFVQQTITPENVHLLKYNMLHFDDEIQNKHIVVATQYIDPEVKLEEISDRVKFEIITLKV
jgi:hypothetical protein